MPKVALRTEKSSKGTSDKASYLLRLDKQFNSDWESILTKHGISKAACLRLLIERFIKEKS